MFADHFIIFYPKDIVSGDFYWLHELKDSEKPTVFIAVVDCTGHGVPGSLMSMIANTLLNELVVQKGISEPNLVLTALHSSIRLYLKQDENENHDGMDVCLCRIISTASTHEITYAGAKRPLFCVKAGKLVELKGTRKSIGGIQDEYKEFTQENITLYANDCMYLTSDGFIDQNNKQRERFATHRFTELLLTLYTLPCVEQKEKMETIFAQFTQDTQQRDDVTVWGIRF